MSSPKSGRRLRVFVSSTMKDLANERAQTCRRLEEYNFEPVNAESWGPNGTGSWESISSQIESSDVLVLLLGDRYGWIPDSGHGASAGLSVTHLEYEHARKAGLPILPFLKRLPYDADRESSDAKLRDNFRRDVQAWSTGRFTAEFELALDLADKVGRAIVGVLADEFQKRQIADRAKTADDSLRRSFIAVHPRVEQVQARAVRIPRALVAAVRSRQAVLFAGAGVSLGAGLPSAPVFIERLLQIIREEDPNFITGGVGSGFAEVASYFQHFFGSDALDDAIGDLVNPPQGVKPTRAHGIAVELFDHTITTNFDTLFERAAQESSTGPYKVLNHEISEGALPERALVKLHGSYDTKSSLIVSETQIASLDRVKPFLWKALVALFRQHVVIVIGTSLRDPSIIRLFTEIGRAQKPRYFVTPHLDSATRSRVHEWDLECIDADAETFMNQLARVVASQA